MFGHGQTVATANLREMAAQAVPQVPDSHLHDNPIVATLDPASIAINDTIEPSAG